MNRTLYIGGLLAIGLIILAGGSLRAQGWKHVGDDSTAFSLYVNGGSSDLLLNLDSAGAPYLFYPDNNFGGFFSARKFDGLKWGLAGTAGLFHPEFNLAPAVSPTGDVYLGINNGRVLPLVYSYNSTGWSQVGTGIFSPDQVSSSATPGLAVDGAGKAYYGIYNAATHSPSVYTFDGQNWVEIGAGDLGNGSGGNFVTMAVDHNNTPYIVYDESNPSVLQASFLVVEKYDGVHWQKVGTTQLYSTSATQVIAFDSNNTPYVICSIGDYYNGYNFKLVKLNAGDWVDVGGTVSPTPGPTGTFGIGAAASSSTNIVQIYLEMTKGDMPMVCYLQNPYMPALMDPNNPGNPGFSKIIVDKFDGTNWVAASDTAVFTAMADAYGQPVLPDHNEIAFSADGNGNAYVAYPFNNVMQVKKMVPNLLTPTINFKDIALTYGQTDLALTATSNNTDPNSPIVYTIGDPTIARIINGKLHILTAGATTITASQSADDQYNAASVQVNVVINKAAQTISMAALGTRSTRDPDLDPKATASSGLPVTYTSSDPSVATVVNGKIHFTGGGTTIITAQQAGNQDYFPAKDSSLQLVVVAFVNTVIDWGDLIKTYGDGDFDPAAVSNSPEPLVFSIADESIAQLQAGKIHILKAGVTTLTVAQAGDASHSPATKSVQLTVYPGQQTIQFPSFPVKSALTPDFPAGAVSGSGTPFIADGLAITYTSSDPSVATVVNGIVHIVGGGSTIVTASQPGNDNYLAARDVSQTLSVVLDTQSITFPPIDARMLGDADFAPGATASSGLLITYTSSDPSIVTIVNDQLRLLKVGTVQITAHQSGNQYYQPANDAYQAVTVNPRVNSPYPATDSLVAYCTSPGSLQVNIFATKDKQADILLYDLYGHRVLEKEVSLSGSITNSYMLPVGNLTSGIYLVRVVGQDTRLSQKIKIVR